ncbi:cyclic nucleotide-binding and patatin-like phospholipase domain-containing protein [Hyalangium gracile]|uniref:cyclic nucleotide-binding and patatin-like phospholipase domain-containing protein n=1 Tax=Hyalangium gracile TaxID=394092 RepID=UPI001CCA8FBA|nr:cyclic nucleotide-binding and patatin-like phospholipase domain-containing protein [Hyalangium gracile]
MTLPPLHFGALSRWLDFHPEQARHLLERRVFRRGTRVFPSPELSGAELPRLLIVLSGEVELIQLLPGCLAPHRPLYRGEVWVNPNQSAEKRRAPKAAIRIEAVATSEVLLLTERGLRSLPGVEAGELERILDDHAELHRSRRTFFKAIRHTVQFQRASVRHLHALIDTAEALSFEGGRNEDPVVIPQGSTLDEHRGVFLVLEGMLGEWREPPMDSERESVLTRALYPGSLFGDVVLHSDNPAPCTVKLHTETVRVARILEKHSERLIRRSPLFASSVSSSPADVWTRIADTVTGLTPPEVVLFRTDAPRVSLGTLLQGVAEATHQAYGDHILRVELVASSTTVPPAPLPEFRSGQVPSYRLEAPNGQAAALALQRLARSDAGRWDYFFVQVEEPRLWSGLEPPEGSAPGFRPLVDGDVTWKLVYLSRDPLEAEPPPGFDRGSVLYSALIEPDSEHRPGPAFPAGTVRLPLEVERFSRPRTLAECGAAEQEIFRRWGRAITERVVGIALGAGGSWGYAEIAVIRGMLERNIPIDVLSGTSFGAVAGACYSSLGLAGLELLLRKGQLFLGVIAASVLNSKAITFAFDRMLGHRRLEKVALPFFPVGTDVSQGQAWVLRRGTMGAAIRSSGIMPGLLSPDFTDSHGRVVDGAFINSVPASVLMSQRANLIVATNVLSAPPETQDPGPLLPGALGLFLHGLNPVGRLADLVRSTLILFHSGGDMNAECADVTFDLPFTPLPPWAFAEGQAFVDKAARVAGPTLDEIDARWKRMSRRRGELVSKIFSEGVRP